MMIVEPKKFLKDTSIERAIILHNSINNEPYLGHSQIILMNNRNEGLLYSFEYDIKSIFSYDLYKNHRNFYNKMYYPISLAEQIRVISKTKPKIRKFHLNSEQLKNIINKKEITVPNNITLKEDRDWAKKQVNYINYEIKNNHYDPFVYYFSAENGKKMLEKAEFLAKESKPYLAFKNNCIQNVIKILNAGGIDVRPTPIPYFASLDQRYFAWKEANSYEEKSKVNNVRNHVSHKIYRAVNYLENKLENNKKSKNSFTAVKMDKRQLEFGCRL